MKPTTYTVQQYSDKERRWIDLETFTDRDEALEWTIEQCRKEKGQWKIIIIKDNEI